jgi:predicted kinase
VATLHFICGRAGAGKTTLARQLARELPAICICEDEWLSRVAPPISNLNDFLTHTSRVRAVLGPHITALLTLGVSVVIDFAGNTPRSRGWVRSLFEAASADHTLHYLPVDERTCRARVHERNGRQPEGIFFGVVSDEQLEEVNRYFTPPTLDEGFNVQEYSVDVTPRE